MNLLATYTAISPNLTSSFLATGGVAPYTYSVQTSGSGGTINSSTGLYTAPANISPCPDVIQATDSLGNIATLPIMIGNPLMFVCDIIQKSMGLDDSQVYIYNQKNNIPISGDLFVSVGIVSSKPFSNSLSYGDGVATQSTNFLTTLGIDIFSRSNQARDRKEELILALNSHYSNQQQQKNSFSIGRISGSFINLSEVEGSAIPYRFNISVNITYSKFKTDSSSDYYNQFSREELIN